MDPNKLSVDLRRETFLDKPLRGLQESSNVAYSSFTKREMKVVTYSGPPPFLQG